MDVSMPCSSLSVWLTAVFAAWTIFNQVVFSKIDWSQERLSLCSNNHCHDLLVCWDHKSDMTSFAETQTTDCRGRSRANPSESRWLACSNGSRTETSMQLTGDAYNDTKRWQKVESLEEAKILPAWTCPNIGIRSCVWMNNQTGRAFRPYQRVPWWCWFVPCLGWLDSLRGLIDLYWSSFLSLMRSSIPSLLKQHYFEHHHQRIAETTVTTRATTSPAATAAMTTTTMKTVTTIRIGARTQQWTQQQQQPR